MAVIFKAKYRAGKEKDFFGHADVSPIMDPITDHMQYYLCRPTLEDIIEVECGIDLTGTRTLWIAVHDEPSEDRIPLELRVTVWKRKGRMDTDDAWIRFHVGHDWHRVSLASATEHMALKHFQETPEKYVKVKKTKDTEEYVGRFSFDLWYRER